MWKVMQAIALFATAGILFAKDFFESIGINAESPIVLALGIGITTMMMYRSLVSILVMVLFAIIIKLPDDYLLDYGIDRQMLLAAAIATLFLPWLQKITTK